MKKNIIRNKIGAIIAATIVLAGLAAAQSNGQDGGNADMTTPPQAGDANLTTADGLSNNYKILIQSVESDPGKGAEKQTAWLGLGVEESPEALSDQLGLKPGEGLTVSYIAADSPAAKVDFRKNDVLAELDGQMLVHPLQLRKLVQMHAIGDTVSLTFFRDGKQQTISVKLGKTVLEQASGTDGGLGARNLVLGPVLQRQLNGMTYGLRGAGEPLARVGLDKAQVDDEISRAVEQARKAIEESVSRTSVERKDMTALEQELKALARNGLDVDKDATVTLRNKHNSGRTIVQTDENGTLIIEAGATNHLTARDKDGQLLFEGDIDTPAQQQKVPKDVWEKAAPLFEQITAPGTSKAKPQQNASQ